MRMPRRGFSRRTLGLASLVLLGVAYRLIYVFDLVGKIDGDNAVIALMAKHILEGRHYVFFWGQSYMGSLESYSIAAAAWIFGLNDVVLRAVPLAYGTLYMASFYPLGRMLGGDRLGGAALALAALCPPLLATWSSAPRGGYAEMLLLGQIVLLLALVIARERADQRRTCQIAALGFVAGLVFWTNFVSMSFLLTAGTILLFRDRWILFRSSTWVAVPAFAIGSLPLWLHNVRHGFDTFTLFTAGRSGGSMAVAARGLVVDHGPKILGIRDLVGDQGILLSPVGYLVGALLLLVLGREVIHRCGDLWNLARGRRPEVGLEACVLLLAWTLALYLPTRFATWNTQRYLLPAYSALIPLLAQAWLRCLSRSRLAGAAITLVVFAVLARGAWTTHVEFAGSSRASGSLPDVVKFLEAHGIRYGYADHNEALVNTYRSGERVVLVDWGIGRYPIREIPDWRPSSLLVRGDGEALVEALAALNCNYQLERFGSHSLIYDYCTETPEGAPLPRGSWRTAASESVEETRLAIDGDPKTRWASHRPQRPGMSFEVDLGEAREVVGVRLHSGSYRSDTPRGLRVEGVGETGDWRDLAVIDHPHPGVALRSGTVRLERHATVEVRFPPTRVYKLRFVQTGDHPAFDWSITELDVLGLDDQ